MISKKIIVELPAPEGYEGETLCKICWKEETDNDILICIIPPDGYPFEKKEVLDVTA